LTLPELFHLLGKGLQGSIEPDVSIYGLDRPGHCLPAGSLAVARNSAFHDVLLVFANKKRSEAKRSRLLLVLLAFFFLTVRL
jgi:hypothetical protein